MYLLGRRHDEAQVELSCLSDSEATAHLERSKKTMLAAPIYPLLAHHNILMMQPVTTDFNECTRKGTAEI